MKLILSEFVKLAFVISRIRMRPLLRWRSFLRHCASYFTINEIWLASLVTNSIISMHTGMIITLFSWYFFMSRIIGKRMWDVCVPGWWSECVLRNPRILSAHREAPTLVPASKTPQGTSGFCSKRLTSLRCCSRWGSWRGCRGWRRLWRGRTCWSTRITHCVPTSSPGQNAFSPAPNLGPKLPLNPAPWSCPCPLSWVLGLTSSPRPIRAASTFPDVAFLKQASSLFTRPLLSADEIGSWGFAWFSLSRSDTLWLRSFADLHDTHLDLD